MSVVSRLAGDPMGRLVPKGHSRAMKNTSSFRIIIEWKLHVEKNSGEGRRGSRWKELQACTSTPSYNVSFYLEPDYVQKQK